MHRFQMQFEDDLWALTQHRAEQEGKSLAQYISDCVKRDLEREPVVQWRGDPLLKLKGRLRSRERFREAMWRCS